MVPASGVHIVTEAPDPYRGYNTGVLGVLVPVRVWPKSKVSCPKPLYTQVVTLTPFKQGCMVGFTEHKPRTTTLFKTKTSMPAPLPIPADPKMNSNAVVNLSLTLAVFYSGGR